MNSELIVALASLPAGALLDDWRWLVGTPHEVLLVTAMGDAFIAGPTGKVSFLDTLEGSLQPVASSRDDFFALLETGRLNPDWFLPDIVELKSQQGLSLAPGQCYGYKLPPVLGGPLLSENVEAIDAVVHFSLSGQLHRQLADTPPGTGISSFQLAAAPPAKDPVRRVLLFVVYSGWLIPLAVARYFSNQELRQAQGLDPIASFPFGAARQQVLEAAWIWLAIAIGLYGWRWLRARRS